jgi:hypothetical protein
MNNFDQDSNSIRGDLAVGVIRRDIRPRWVAEVNQAMDLPLPKRKLPLILGSVGSFLVG